MQQQPMQILSRLGDNIEQVALRPIYGEGVLATQPTRGQAFSFLYTVRMTSGIMVVCGTELPGKSLVRVHPQTMPPQCAYT